MKNKRTMLINSVTRIPRNLESIMRTKPIVTCFYNFRKQKNAHPTYFNRNQWTPGHHFWLRKCHIRRRKLRKAAPGNYWRSKKVLCDEYYMDPGLLYKSHLPASQNRNIKHSVPRSIFERIQLLIEFETPMILDSGGCESVRSLPEGLQKKLLKRPAVMVLGQTRELLSQNPSEICMTTKKSRPAMVSEKFL